MVTENDVDTIKEGRLLKKGHFASTWTSRYFVLKQTELLYYQDENKMNKKGEYKLDYNSILLHEEDGKRHLFCMRLYADGSGGGELLLSAPDIRTYDEWFAAITSTIQSLRPSAHDKYMKLQNKQLDYNLRELDNNQAAYTYKNHFNHRYRNYLNDLRLDYFRYYVLSLNFVRDFVWTYMYVTAY